MLKSRINYIRIDGRIDVKKRYDAVKKFQNDPKCQVAVLSLTASSQGITLTAAQCVVFAEMNWTPGIMIQAEDRAHRIGQASSVTCYYLYGEDTIDSLIYPRLRLKSEVIATVVDGKIDDSTFKITENSKVPHSKIKQKVEPPQSFVPYKNFNNFYDVPPWWLGKNGGQYQQNKIAVREDPKRLPTIEDDKDKDPNEEPIKEGEDFVENDRSQSDDSEDKEFDDDTDVAMPVIPSLQKYNDLMDENSGDVNNAMKKKISAEERDLQDKKQFEQMNINDFFFCKP